MTDEQKNIDHPSNAPAGAPAPAAADAASTTPHNPRDVIQMARLRVGLIGVSIGLVALVGAMAVQSARHGWPFSLHHGYVEVAGKVRRAPVLSNSGDEPPGAQPRAPITLAQSRATEFGVRVEQVRSEPTARTIRAVATVVPDESRVSEIHTRVSGWIEELYVNKTGQTVSAGQALAAIFSPELVAAQNELLALKKAIGGQEPLLDGARSRLRVLGMSGGQIAALEARGQTMRLVSVTSPHKGVVLRRDVAVGTAIDPSTELMTIADLSKVWVLAEVSERDVPDVPVGTVATLAFPAAGEMKPDAKVAFIYPTLTERTRTLRVRFELDSSTGRLKPGMYGSATFQTGERRALTVSRDAIVDTGLEQHVFVVESPDHYVPRKVEVGVELGDRVEIRSGLMENETVVASGVFLIDSESRLRASGGGAMAGMKMDSNSTPNPPGSRADSDAGAGAMPGMKMEPDQRNNAPSPAPTASGRVGGEADPMQMPMPKAAPMQMPMPETAPHGVAPSASSAHSGHGE